MILLKNERLRVEIAHPGEAPNNTTRFDRAGFITEVVLDGAHRFCASEPNNLPHPSSGGRGLCCEYVFDTSREASVGERFPKLGVGLLKKESESSYKFTVKYDAEPFPVNVETGGDYAVFTTDPVDCLGYGAAQIKTVRLEKNELTVSVSLTNTGRLPIEGREYCHNFISLNGMALGPDYRIDFENARELDSVAPNGLLSFSGKSVRFGTYRREPSYAAFPIEKFITGNVFCWTLENTAAAARVCARDEIDLCGAALWAADHIVSVESFHRLSIKPGESSNWKRTWRFENI